MKKITYLIVVLTTLMSQLSIAQQEDFTYISDRKFFVPNDLIGYDFRPEAMEIRGEREAKLSPGEYSFGISTNNLYVIGEGIKGVYSVNNINPTEYGYKLMLMNARDPRIQGHLKLMLNKRAQVEAIVFKRSNKDPEMIFYLAFMKDKVYNTEKAFFTDKNERSLTDQDTIWNTTLYPFFRIHENQGGVQERLQISDSTQIEFIEKITLVEKKKKKRKKKKKKRGKKNKEEEVSEEGGELAVEELETEVVEADAGAMPPVEAAESMEEATATEEEQKEVVKVKIVKEYFVKVRSILTYEDGTTEDKTWEYPVKNKMQWYETRSSDPMVAPFEVELSGTKKGQSVTLLVSKNRTINAVTVDGKRYLMRGH